MRTFQSLLFLLLLVATNNCFASNKDSLIYKSEHVLVTFNLRSKEYTVEANETYKHLKFVQPISRTIQVLDKKNNVFFIDEDGNKQLEVEDYFMVCGTVPHYQLSVQKNTDAFEIYEDETFYDHGNKIPAEITKSIDISVADSVVFINGKSTFFFTSNFSVGIGNVNPRTVFFIKDGKYATSENPDIHYDQIDFSNHHRYLLTQRDGLWGILEVVEPKYLKIEKFNYYLAQATKENGKVIYIDINGNEY